MAAKEMLLGFLKKSRTRRSVAKGKGVGSTGDPIDIVSLSRVFYFRYVANDYSPKAIDTVLAKLCAEFEKTQELYALLQTPHDIFLPEVEPVLQSTGQYNALCLLYKHQGDDLKLLDTWSK
jgi:hypothetical protein